tara:strand:- start:67 stop:606 length:540 start_codon:yes stop_codon:yes gene_type:complete
MEKYIEYYEEVVPHVLCNDIINYDFNFKPADYSSHKGIIENSTEQVYMDEAWIRSGNIYYNDIKDAFEYATTKYAEGFPLTFSVQHITDFRISRYLKDGFMSSHVDNIHHSHGQQYGYPQVSVLLFLNSDYEGGEFIVADNVYSPKKGSSIVFPSNFIFPHEVKKVTKGIRWSIVAWLM